MTEAVCQPPWAWGHAVPRRDPLRTGGHQMPYALYVCLQDEDKIAAFTMDATTGQLTPTTAPSVRGTHPPPAPTTPPFFLSAGPPPHQRIAAGRGGGRAGPKGFGGGSLPTRPRPAAPQPPPPGGRPRRAGPPATIAFIPP